MSGEKHDAGKPAVAEMMHDFARAFAAVSEVWSHGAIKYSPGGWRDVDYKLVRYTNAMQRHFLAEGIEPSDQSSGCLHAAHVAWNALCRLEIILQGWSDKANEFDMEPSTYDLAVAAGDIEAADEDLLEIPDYLRRD